MECSFVDSTKECHAGSFEESCGCHGRSTWWIRPCSGRRILVLSPRKKKKKISHRERRARAKARVVKWRCQALLVALVERC